MNTKQLSRRDWLISASLIGFSFTPVKALSSIFLSEKLLFKNPNSRLSHREMGFVSDENLVPNKSGGYLFLPGTETFSFGAVAADGFQIVRALYRNPPHFPEGLEEIKKYMSKINRPIQALCGLELRSGHQGTLPEFLAFNKFYVKQLQKLGLLVNNQVPIARTNMAIPGTEAAERIYAFTYTIPLTNSSSKQPPTFMLAGIPDVRNLRTKPEIVSEGDTSMDGLRQKMTFILETIGELLQTINAGWSDVTGIQLYTMHDVHPLITSIMLPKVGEAGHRGIKWHNVQLPVVGGDMEIDVRSTCMELMI